MATVYRGHDEQLGRDVAVKIMHADLGDDADFVRRFEAEARRAASVSHPNLVAIYDVGTEEGAPYIVMELVEGGDLAALLRRGRPLEPRQAAQIAVEVAAALEAAHDAGLVHRDVKPGNILMGSDGRPRVADFGIARATGEESLTRTGAMLGSVEYFSPEQARGERATPASDVYGLGVVLYELLTGSRPFSGDSPYAVATARLRQPAPDPRRARRAVPEALSAIVLRAMAVTPTDRFGSAAEMRGALEQWLSASGSATAPSLLQVRPGTAGASTPAAAVRPEAEVQEAPGSRRRRRRHPAAAPARRLTMAVPLALAAVAIAGAGFVVMQLIGGPGGTPAIGNPLDIVVGTPGGAAEAGESETPDQATPTPEPSTTPRPRASTPPQSAPTVAATPIPTVRASAPAATPRPSEPATVALAGGPEDAVAAFYAAVVDERFDAAYALWSDRMKATYPRPEQLDDRFADTAAISFSELRVASRSGADATVQANFTERYDTGSSRDFIGYWRLVRVDGRWLLDEPNY